VNEARLRLSPRADRGFTLIEMIIVVFLLAIAMLGLLAVFDASARINKSEQQVADAQGSVRYGVYQMTRIIRMAGSGGIFVTQAILNQNDANLAGISPAGASFDNVNGVTVTDLSGNPVPVRDGTDMIEIRGVILSPLLSFDLQTGCGGCTGVNPLTVKPVTFIDPIGQHYNNDASNRPQFAAIDGHATASPTQPRFVVVSANDDIHACSVPFGAQQYAQPSYNVGVITANTQLVSANTFGNVDFTSTAAQELNNEDPAVAGTPAATINNVRRAGVLDDILFFISDVNPQRPALVQAVRRGTRFDTTTIIADEVEDMQIAYGVDTDGNNAINRLVATGGADTDPNVSTVADGDEWAPNVDGEAVFTAADFVAAPAPLSCPRLHGVMIALVARSRDPDPTYRAPSAVGIRTMNTPSTIDPPLPDTAIYPGPNPSPFFRRRIQTLKINLRNYAFPG
jgi:prepilin-type N-terminal cleavage/methylation domain-containing protein